MAAGVGWYTDNRGGVEPAREADRTVTPEEAEEHEAAEAGTDADNVPVAPVMEVAVEGTGLFAYLPLLLLLLVVALLLAALLLKMVREALGKPAKLFCRRNTFGTARRGGLAGGWLIPAATCGLQNG